MQNYRFKLKQVFHKEHIDHTRETYKPSAEFEQSDVKLFSVQAERKRSKSMSRLSTSLQGDCVNTGWESGTKNQ